MAEAKTKPTKSSVQEFLRGVEDVDVRRDCQTLAKLMGQATKATPKMWGPSMVGFGNYHYRYASGHEGDCFVVGFSPRKTALTLYLMGGLEPHAALLRKLGKHKTGKGCLYIKRLEDVDPKVLGELIRKAVAQVMR